MAAVPLRIAVARKGLLKMGKSDARYATERGLCQHKIKFN